jgi:hypothetical protein
VNPATPHHLPFFITAPGHADVLYVLMALLLVGGVLGTGIFFFWLHSLPERMVHHKLQYDIAAVLCLLSLFTHEHVFWVLALLLAFIRFPEVSTFDFFGPLKRIAVSLERIADNSSEMTAPPLSTRVDGGREKGA